LALLSLSLLVGTTHGEDPLPLVQPKSSGLVVTDTPQASSMPDLFAAPQIVMAVVPLRDLTAVTAVDTTDPTTLRSILRDAVKANDRTRFDAALARARSVSEVLPAGDERNALRRAVTVYGDLQKVWDYASTDPYGAFFNDESLPGLHDRLASDYPGYAAYISPGTVTDQRGHVFYPTAETRAFLLRQVGNGGIQLAQRQKPEARSTTTQPAPSVTTHPTIARRHVRLHKAAVEPKPQPQPKAVEAPAPVVVAAATPQPVAATPQPAVVTLQPSNPATQQPTTDALANDLHRAANPASAAPVQAKVISNPNQTQGLLFIIIALVTIGVMTIWARTPQASSQPPQIFKPVEPPVSAEAPAVKKQPADIVQIKQNRAS
jgi:hypothetical protein